MATIRAYTTISQGKTLSKILPIESADMCYGIDDDTLKYNDLPWLIPYHEYTAKEYYTPCWSLAALLRELPDTILGKDKDGYVVIVETMGSGMTAFASNPIDACYEMIIKLYKQKLL